MHVLTLHVVSEGAMIYAYLDIDRVGCGSIIRELHFNGTHSRCDGMFTAWQ